ncbi:transcription factor SRM1-like [Durio zibethinus]|uniref:Transcription factor SRM1-like n=1 Tax=Durio zibethinus TaxID=66656 RepID=A0A6P5ZLH4_DURZI|nr:transcription factor SRM1-like [Durio zibethinus]
MIRTNNDFGSSWSWHQDKLFERALVMFTDEESPDRWEKIAAQVPGKSAMEVRKHYEDLEHDVMEIEAGRVELPSYEGELESMSWVNESGDCQVWSGPKGKERERENERRKGVPWTAEEHRLFLIGLQKYGKGDWRSISRNAVVSRTPTQVASHAQKYFLRLNSINKKDKRRSSIHDTTTADCDNCTDQNGVGTKGDQGSSFGNNHGFQFPLL